MMNFGVSFSPLVPAYMVWTAAAVAFAIALLLVLGRSRGALARAVALALFVLALANPSVTREDREPLTSVAAVVVDKSPSQEFGDRTRQTEQVRATLAERLAHLPGVEVRFVGADGRVHDVPADAAALGFAAPVHALITGHSNERDRRVVLTAAPRFGIVGQTQTVSFRIEDQGGGGSTARVTVRRDGETIENRN